MSQVSRISADQFQAQVYDSPVPVLVDFYADWCAPCRALAPTLDALAAELDGQVRIVKVSVDDEPALARQYEIRSIPTLVLFVAGEPAARVSGLASADQLRQTIAQAQAA